MWLLLFQKHKGNGNYLEKMLQNRYVGLFSLRLYILIGQIGLLRSENVTLYRLGTFYVFYILFKWIKAVLFETVALIYTSNIRRMNKEHQLNDTKKRCPNYSKENLFSVYVFHHNTVY